jgi:predicted signal transduction protein with EAL and GGDEF domain
LPARIGGDEFAVLVAPVTDTETLVALAHRLIAVIGQPVELGGRRVVVNASVGITISGGEEPTGPEIMLRDADAAMYHAKAVGKGGVQVFDHSMHVSAIERLDVKGDLAHALDRRELVLHYQPILNLATSQIIGFETLVRWQHPTRGLVSPATFLPIAEETGLISDMGRWILRTALQQLAAWQVQHPALKMSVNLAPSQLAAAGIVGEVAGVLELTGVAPSTVVLELTEDRVLEDETWIRRLCEIRALGVGLEADDFGSGFASYAALQRLPFSGVKIDRSLISALGDTVEDGSGPQVRSIIEMAHAIGLGVVAEGIEGARQAAVLRALGCDLAQGFYFARPAPADAFEELLSHADPAPLST